MIESDAGQDNGHEKSFCVAKHWHTGTQASSETVRPREGFPYTHRFFQRSSPIARGPTASEPDNKHLELNLCVLVLYSL